MSNGPAFRLKFRDKNKQTFDVGTVWEGRFPDSFDVKPQIGDEAGKYPKMDMGKAIARVAAKDGFISLQKPRSDAASRSGGNYDRTAPTNQQRGEWDDPEIPF